MFLVDFIGDNHMYSMYMKDICFKKRKLRKFKLYNYTSTNQYRVLILCFEFVQKYQSLWKSKPMNVFELTSVFEILIRPKIQEVALNITKYLKITLSNFKIKNFNKFFIKLSASYIYIIQYLKQFRIYYRLSSEEFELQLLFKKIM